VTDTFETLLDRADKAMYAGKNAGRNRVTLYEAAMGTGSSPGRKSAET
jgi:predicted signal transduction protein with EAL and GGDEF domain